MSLKQALKTLCDFITSQVAISVSGHLHDHHSSSKSYTHCTFLTHHTLVLPYHTGNLTVIYDNSTIIVDSTSLFQTNVTAPGSNLTAAVSSSSLAVNAGTNLTLLVSGVFSQPATSSTPVTLLHSNPGGPSYPLAQNITTATIPTAAGSGNSTLFVAAANGGK